MKARIAKLHLISKKGGKSEIVLFEFLQKYEKNSGKTKLSFAFILVSLLTAKYFFDWDYWVFYFTSFIFQ